MLCISCFSIKYVFLIFGYNKTDAIQLLLTFSDNWIGINSNIWSQFRQEVICSQNRVNFTRKLRRSTRGVTAKHCHSTEFNSLIGLSFSAASDSRAIIIAEKVNPSMLYFLFGAVIVCLIKERSQWF